MFTVKNILVFLFILMLELKGRAPAGARTGNKYSFSLFLLSRIKVPLQAPEVNIDVRL